MKKKPVIIQFNKVNITKTSLVKKVQSWIVKLTDVQDKAIYGNFALCKKKKKCHRHNKLELT